MFDFTESYSIDESQKSSSVLTEAPTPLKNIKKANSPIEQQWNQCLHVIRSNTTEGIFKTWFLQLKPIKYQKQTLNLKVPSRFFVDWIEENYYDLLLKTVNRVFGEGSTIDFEIVIDKSDDLNERTLKLPGQSDTARQNTLKFEQNEKKDEVIPDNLQPTYSFTNFVTGDCNQFAASAARAVADKPRKNSYSPLFLFGKTGVGKTHLLNAIGNHIKSSEKDLKIFYTSGEKFHVHFVEKVLSNSTSSFMKFYRQFDVLIIDDIHFLSGKEKTQDNFFHVFNELYQQGKLIAISSDKAVNELVGIDERLISRFSQGLCVDIQQPDYETRLAIILKKSREEGCELPMDIAEYIATNYTRNIRNIEGAIIKLYATVAFGNQPMSLQLAQRVLGDDLKETEKKKKLDVETIQEMVSVQLGISVEDMVSKSRKHEIALARQLAIALTRKLTRMPLKKIGAAFGGRDHATVLHSIKTIENYVFTDPSVKKDYETLYEQCCELL